MNQMTVEFALETMKARWKWNNIFFFFFGTTFFEYYKDHLIYLLRFADVKTGDWKDEMVVLNLKTL